MTVAIILIVLVFVGSSAGLVGTLYGKVNAKRHSLEKNLAVLQEEVATKKRILAELCDLALGLAPQSDVDKLNESIAKLEEDLRAEQGRYTITQAELDAVENRLRELEEVERELEASALESTRELEMLRSQEQGLKERNSVLREQLESTFKQLDKLLAELESSQEIAQRIAGIKGELTQTQEKIQWYTEEIVKLNQKYTDLKNAYDALDIEYAQLYEKQNQLEAAREAAARKSSGG